MSEALAIAERWLLRAITDGPAPRSLSRLGDTRVSVATGLNIYRNAYRSRLIECLADDFAALRRLLGDDPFTDLANTVITELPPSDATLNSFGKRLVTVLRRRPSLTIHGRLALDLARLEWALVEAIHAPLARVIDPAVFSAIPADGWARVRLRGAPSLRLIASRWPIDGCYRQYLRDAPVVAPQPSAEVVVIVRRAEGIERRTFIPAAGRLIARLARGVALGPALDGFRQPAETVAMILRQATELGCFTELTYPGISRHRTR